MAKKLDDYLPRLKGRITKSFLICFLLTLYPALSFAGQFKVVRVYDGDTVMAAGHGITIKVRLLGIDAPETAHGKRKPGQPFSQRSKKYVVGENASNDIIATPGMNSKLACRLSLFQETFIKKRVKGCPPIYFMVNCKF